MVQLILGNANARIDIVGPLTGGENSDGFERLAADVISSDVATVIVDMQRCTLWNSTGIGQLLMLHREMKVRGRTCRIVSANTHFLQILETLKLTAILEVYPSLVEAENPDRAASPPPG